MTATEKKDHLVKDSFILFIASSVVNASNFVFHMYVTRNLKPEEYGVLATLLAMIMIVTMPSTSLQMTVVNKTAAFKARENFGSIEYLFKFATFWFLMLSLLAFSMLAGAGGFIRDFFNIDDTALVYILGGIVVISFLFPVVKGLMQGMQKFIGLGSTLMFDALLRLTFLVVFIKIGWGVRGALATTLCSAIAAYILGLFIIRPVFKFREKETVLIRKRELFGYALPVFAAFLGFSLLSYMDLFMVKHFFEKEQAGLYAVTSIIGKAFLFFPSAIIMAMFPKVAEHRELNKNPKKMLFTSLALTAGVSVLGIIFCFFFPDIVVGLLTGGGKYYEINGIVRLFGIAILPLVLFNVIVNYSLAMHKYRFIYFMYGGIALYAALLWFFHSSFYWVLGVLFGVNLLMLLLSALTIDGGQKAVQVK